MSNRFDSPLLTRFVASSTNGKILFGLFSLTFLVAGGILGFVISLLLNELLLTGTTPTKSFLATTSVLFVVWVISMLESVNGEPVTAYGDHDDHYTIKVQRLVREAVSLLILFACVGAYVTLSILG